MEEEREEGRGGGRAGGCSSRAQTKKALPEAERRGQLTGPVPHFPPAAPRPGL